MCDDCKDNRNMLMPYKNSEDVFLRLQKCILSDTKNKKIKRRTDYVSHMKSMFGIKPNEIYIYAISFKCFHQKLDFIVKRK